MKKSLMAPMPTEKQLNYFENVTFKYAPEKLASSIVKALCDMDYVSRRWALHALAYRANREPAIARVVSALFMTPKALAAIGRPEMVKAGTKALLAAYKANKKASK